MEVELKFVVEPKYQEDIEKLFSQLNYHVVDSKVLQLENGYYDTEDNQLRQLDFGLRTRSTRFQDGTVKAEQTIKLAGKDVGGLMQRPEHTVALDQVSAFADLFLFDDAIWDDGFDVSGIQRQLKQTFSTQFTRHKWLVEMHNGAIVECVYDLGEVAVIKDNQLKTERISEIELELVQGHNKDIFTLAHYLTRHIDCKLGHLSKAARGYMLAQDQTLSKQNLAPIEFSFEQPLEDVFISVISEAIRFTQHHELVFSQKANIKVLRRIMDGISLLIHMLELASPIFYDAFLDENIRRFKKIRKDYSWVEKRYQVSQLQGRQSPYRKDMEQLEELALLKPLMTISEDKVEEIEQYFSSNEFNRVMLDLLEWLTSKQWRNSMALSELPKLSQPIGPLAQDWFDTHWKQVVQALDNIEQAKTVEELEVIYWPVAKALLTGMCVSGAFHQEEKETFRSQMFNLLVGLEEHILLTKLTNKYSQQDSTEKLIKWLSRKLESLHLALVPSALSAKKLKPYWN